MKYDKVAVAHAMPLTYAASVPAQPILGDDLDSTIPAELRSWLVRLRLLEGVPFANLVADTELLPAESMRWFYLDRRWTDALVQGALSVGTVNSDDRTHLTAQYPAIRDELDVEERNHRRAEGSARFGGRVEAVSGFILRSEAVSGWPGLHVRAFSVDPEESDDATYLETDPRRMRLLRLERLAPAVLFCLFDGIPKVVHVEEPRQGVQFGFHMRPAGQGVRATLFPRDKTTFSYINMDGDALVGPQDPDDGIAVPFRAGPGTSGVVDIQRLEQILRTNPKTKAATGADDGLDAAEYALQLIRFPYRQVFGADEGITLAKAFRATIAYQEHVSTTFRFGGNP
ncbi:MAG: hypothetical protein U0R75_08250 [Dermatophilaceae bacterium]|uniref:hypothetical protein n=3 Tax=Phycicoccus elongatus TaxID=101689 RepID=UPI001D867892|nr:hypothetical protein [Phycicoccus elongatus]MCB1240409.1 hypothetical protein [Tetrasphaera sp.]HPQ74081.1 hypothetical protein [Phycicoccus elongatus]